MKETPLTATHFELGAKMTDFAGYNMPVVYTSIQEEHQCVRTNVGMFDVSHMGEFIVRGKEALQLVQHVTSNDASKLAIGQAQYSCFPNAEGGIVDDLLVYRLPNEMSAEEEDVFMLVVNASNIEKDWNWLQMHNHYDARLINISDETGLLAIQGPNATAVLQGLTDIDLAGMKYYTFAKGTIAGVPNVLISATGYTGAGGFEVYTPSSHTKTIWDAVMAAGNAQGLQPIGLGARDTLRLEMGFCLYGNDIDDTTSPMEAGLSWITKIKKGDFISQATFARQKQEGVSRKLVGLTVEGRRVPRHGYGIEDQDGNSIGEITSGTQAPSLGYPIGMGYVETAFAQEGTDVQVVMGSKRVPGTVVKFPFYKNA